MKEKLQIGLLSLGILAAAVFLFELPGRSQQSQSASQVQQTATMANSATKIANANPGINNQATATMTPSGSNYVYITAISFDGCQDNTGTTIITNLTFTSTNITGAPTWNISDAATANLCAPTRTITFSAPLKSSTPGTATTLVSPASNAHAAYTINAVWYEAP